MLPLTRRVAAAAAAGVLALSAPAAAVPAHPHTMTYWQPGGCRSYTVNDFGADTVCTGDDRVAGVVWPVVKWQRNLTGGCDHLDLRILAHDGWGRTWVPLSSAWPCVSATRRGGELIVPGPGTYTAQFRTVDVAGGIGVWHSGSPLTVA